MAKVTPLHDRLLFGGLKKVRHPGGIIIPDSAKEKPQEGEVISVGKARATTKGRCSPWR